MKGFIESLIYRIRGEVSTEKLIKRGMKVGKNFKRMAQVVIDPGHCWLVEIGDNVTLAPRCYILCHDASTKQYLDYAKIGRVVIGDNVFVGAGSYILPGVHIGNNVIIGANSTVCHDIPDNTVVAGSPAVKLFSTEDYLERMKAKLDDGPVFGEEYTMRGSIGAAEKEKMNELLREKMGFVK